MAIGPFSSKEERHRAVRAISKLTDGSVELADNGSIRLTDALGRVSVQMKTSNVSNVRMSCGGAGEDRMLMGTLNAPVHELRDARMEIEVALADCEGPVRIVPKKCAR
jgi:hypothetical protein